VEHQRGDPDERHETEPSNQHSLGLMGAGRCKKRARTTAAR
jgi:hypothetical protein